ncbi:MAG: hypothetical protein WEC41_00370 [Dongiaceae bacterium]
MTGRIVRSIACVAALGLAGVPGWAAGDEPSVLGGDGQALSADTLAATSGRQLESDESVLVFPFADNAGSAVAGMRAHNITVGGLEVAAPRPGPAVGTMGFNLVGAATRPNF